MGAGRDLARRDTLVPAPTVAGPSDVHAWGPGATSRAARRLGCRARRRWPAAQFGAKVGGVVTASPIIVVAIHACVLLLSLLLFIHSRCIFVIFDVFL
jgi:hypothetical protein